MGRPKQTIRLDGSPLVVRAVEATLGAGAGAVVVVVGAGADPVSAVLHEHVGSQLSEGVVRIVHNPDWQDGMSSSIRVGLASVREGSKAPPDGVLLALCDQPAFDSAAARSLAYAWAGRSEGQTVAAAAYAGLVGAPVVFGAEHFSELAALRGDEGARSILRRHPSAIIEVALPDLAQDLDTPEDVSAWSRSRQRGEAPQAKRAEGNGG